MFIKDLYETFNILFPLGILFIIFILLLNYTFVFFNYDLNNNQQSLKNVLSTNSHKCIFLIFTKLTGLKKKL